MPKHIVSSYCDLFLWMWKCILPSSIHQFPSCRPPPAWVESGPLSCAVRLEFASRPSVSVSREEGGRQRRSMQEALWVFMARAQKRPFTLMGGQSVHARLCLGREHLGLLLTLLPSNNHAVSPQRQGWWCQERSKRTRLLNIRTHIQ